jgi:hypothetical protein
MSMSAEVDQDARKLVKSLYTAMEAKPMQWPMVTGLSSKQAAVDYAVEKGWLLVERGRSVSLIEEGCGASPHITVRQHSAPNVRNMPRPGRADIGA